MEGVEFGETSLFLKLNSAKESTMF
jgi:hypothetical protein